MVVTSDFGSDSIGSNPIETTTKNIMEWDKLSMSEKTKYIGLGVQNGITNLSHIKKAYNSYAEGGNIGGTTVVDRATGQRMHFNTRDEANDYVTANYLDPNFYQGELPELTVTARRPVGLLEQGARNFEETFGLPVRDAAGLIPYVGDALDVVDIGKSAYEGDYAEAGLNLASLVIPNLIEKPLKMGYRAVRSLLRNPKRKRQLGDMIFEGVPKASRPKWKLNELEEASQLIEDIRGTGYRGRIYPNDIDTRSDFGTFSANLKGLKENLQIGTEIASDYSSRMNTLENNPILYGIAKESPQYLDRIYDDYIEGRISNIEDYVRNLISEQNTFIRRMRNRRVGRNLTERDFLNITSSADPGVHKDSSWDFPENYGYLNVGNQNVAAQHYGPIIGLYTPKQLNLSGDVSTWWNQRRPNLPEGVYTLKGMHQGQWRNWGDKFDRSILLEKDVNAYLGDLGVPDMYRTNQGHIVFAAPKGTSIADKFDVRLISEEELEALNRPLTLGYKYGGMLKQQKKLHI